MMQIRCSAKNDNSICDSDVLVPKYEPPHRCSGSTQSYNENVNYCCSSNRYFHFKKSEEL